jgi:protein-S-isoprenylcysteine O-methyltransferase Ste14
MRIGLDRLPYAVSRRAQGPGTPFPPTFFFIIGFAVALWADWQQPWRIDPQPDAHLWTRLLIGLAAIVAGSAIAFWGLATMARVRTGILLQRPASRLVHFGPYRWTRNPQYVGFVAIYFGLAVVANSVWPFVFLPVVLALLITVVIAREERYLHGVFGREYADYCRRVKRWL